MESKELILQTSIEPGKIVNNFVELRDQIRVEFEQYRGLQVTEENLPASKKDLARMRALLTKEIDRRRIDTKKEWLKPFELFEAEVKEFTREMTDTFVTPLASQIEAFEVERVRLREEFINKTKETELAKVPPVIARIATDALWFDDSRWTNATMSEAAVVKGILAKIEGIITDLTALALTHDDPHANAVILEYTKSGNLAQALTLHRELIKRSEEQAAAAVKEAEEEVVETEMNDPSPQEEEIQEHEVLTEEEIKTPVGFRSEAQPVNHPLFSKKYTYVEVTLTEQGDPKWYAVRDSETGKLITILPFQSGPIKEVGANGVHNEDLLLIVLDRLAHFQAGPYACEENAKAIEAIEDAARHLRLRSLKREARGVEGTREI